MQPPGLRRTTELQEGLSCSDARHGSEGSKSDPLDGHCLDVPLELLSVEDYTLLFLIIHSYDVVYSFFSNKLHHFLKSVSFNNGAGEAISFDRNGQIESRFDIINWVTFPNQSFHRVKVGEMQPLAPPGKELTTEEDVIVWPSHFNQVGPTDLIIGLPVLHFYSDTDKFLCEPGMKLAICDQDHGR